MSVSDPQEKVEKKLAENLGFPAPIKPLSQFEQLMSRDIELNNRFKASFHGLKNQ